MNNDLTFLEIIIVIIGGIMAWPWLFTIFRSFGRALIVTIWPKKSVVLEIEDEDGSVTRKKINLSHDDELVKTILAHAKVKVVK